MCAKYDREHPTYNKSLSHFREVLGVRMQAEETLLQIDLSDAMQVRVMIDLFANPWGAKLPAWDSPDRDDGVATIREWWRRCRRCDALPAVTERLVAADDVQHRVGPYGWLSNSIARPRLNRRLGPTAASKLAYVARPYFYIAWDVDIRAALGTRKGTADDYEAFLLTAQQRMRELLPGIERSADAARLKDAERSFCISIGQPDCTLAEAINKYCWCKARE